MPDIMWFKSKFLRLRTNYMNAAIVETVVLLVIGVVLWLLLDGQALLRLVREEMDVLIELEHDVRETQRDSLLQWLEEQVWVKQGSVVWISKEEAAQVMKQELGADFLELGMPNPFYDMVKLHVASEQFGAELFQQLRTIIGAREGVRDVFYQEVLVAAVSRNVARFAWAFALLAILLGLVAALVIFHTTKLSLYTNRFLIKNMELIGASWAFIARPFLLRSLLTGVWAGVWASLGLLAIMYLAVQQFPELAQLQPPTQKVCLFSSLILAGAGLNLLSAWWVVHHYLRMRIDDLYA